MSSLRAASVELTRLRAAACYFGFYGFRYAG
jgi:hypothetical protein